eukprot:scaffold173057_cov30-Cyclotella_meneghiniana.AAC.1
MTSKDTRCLRHYITFPSINQLLSNNYRASSSFRSPLAFGVVGVVVVYVPFIPKHLRCFVVQTRDIIVLVPRQDGVIVMRCSCHFPVPAAVPMINATSITPTPPRDGDHVACCSDTEGGGDVYSAVDTVTHHHPSSSDTEGGGDDYQHIDIYVQASVPLGHVLLWQPD